MSVINNGREKTVDSPRSGPPSSATDESQVEQVTSVLDRARCISWPATEVGILTANIYHVVTSSMGKREVGAKWNPHMLSDDHRSMRVLLSTTYLQQWSNECIPRSRFNGWQNAEWRAQKSPERKLHGAVRLLWRSCLLCSSAEMDSCLTYDNQWPIILRILARQGEAGCLL